jgi:hypothetical protein
VRSRIARTASEGRGIRGPGHRRKETAGEYASRTSGCVYLSAPGGLPYRRLTFTLRDPRAPGLLEVRGFCLPGEVGHPVREGDAATRDESEGNPMHEYHQMKGPNQAWFSATFAMINGRGVHTAAQAPTDSLESEPPKSFTDRWGSPEGRLRLPCWEQISH